LMNSHVDQRHQNGIVNETVLMDSFIRATLSGEGSDTSMFQRHVPIFAQLLVGMFTIALLVIAITNMFNYNVTSEVLLNRTADYTQESVEQLSAKIDVLLRQYDQFSQTIAFDERVQKMLAESPEKYPKIDVIGINRYMAEKARFIAGDILIQMTRHTFGRRL